MYKTVNPAKILITTIAFIALLITVISCKKSSDEEMQSEEQQQLTRNAEENNKVLPGIGNIFMEKELAANSSNQLFMVIPYKTDTLAFYGSATSTGTLNKITAIVSKNAATGKMLVSEFLNNEPASLVYTISGNVKSRYVVKTIQYNDTEKELQLLDYNWQNGEYTVLQSTFFRNGRVIANSKTSGASTLADQPCRTGDVDPNDLSAVVDDRLKDIACGGGHPIIEEIKDFLNSIDQSISDFDADEFIKRFDDQKGFMNSITNLFKDFKLDFSDLDTKSLSKLVELLNKYKEEEGRVLSLIPMQAISDLDYDEITDSEVKLVFTVEDPKTNMPYTKEPVYVDISYYAPGSSVPVFSETRLGSTSGIVTFKLDPLTLPNYWTIKNLEARYKFSRGTAIGTSPVTLKYIIPEQITVHSGNNQFASAGKPLSSPLSVLVEDAAGRVLPYVEVSWTVSAGTGTLSNQKTTTNEHGIASVNYTLDASTKTQTIQANAKRPNGTTVGEVTFTATIGNAFTEKLLGTWQVVKYTVYSDSDYANSVKAYAERDTKLYPDNYHFKPVGNNTVMDTSPYTITFRDDAGFAAYSTHWYYNTQDHFSGSWTVSDNGFISSRNGGGTWQDMTGQLVEISENEFRINSSASLNTRYPVHMILKKN